MHSDVPQHYHNARRVQGAYADWLRPRKWDHVVHVSLRQGCSEEHAWAAFARGVRRLDTWARARVDWFCAVERGPAGRLTHFHALLHGTSALTV